jgi:aconitate hydratase
LAEEPQRSSNEIQYRPARVLLQDFTGVPCVVDLAAMRDAIATLGGDTSKINPLVPVNLVIDHSVMVDEFGHPKAFEENMEIEYQRNMERYDFLKWGSKSLNNFYAVPPGTGICHQVNLEHIAQAVWTSDQNGETVAYPDTCVGTDSHTTMVNGLGVLGWGVGGIEAEAAMLGQPVSMLIPEVVGFKFTGRLKEGVTATDLVLTATNMLRKHGVVGRFVEYYGPGLADLTLADRATLANMAPEYGATCGFFGIDEKTLDYLRLTGRDEARSSWSKPMPRSRASGSTPPSSRSSPRRSNSTSRRSCPRSPVPSVRRTASAARSGRCVQRRHGQCLQEGPDPRSGRRQGLHHRRRRRHHRGDHLLHQHVEPRRSGGRWSGRQEGRRTGPQAQALGQDLAGPGSQVVTDYLERAGLQKHLDNVGFNLVGYGCTTCIGNSGPLAEPISKAINENGLVAAAVISGNRNFEGRVSPDVRANFLASPPLVVAYALKGTVIEDFTTTRSACRRMARTCSSRTSGRPTKKSPPRWPVAWTVRCSSRAMPTCTRATSTGRRSTSPVRKPMLAGRFDLCRQPALLRRHDHGTGPGSGHHRSQAAADPGRFDHHRPHQPRRQHQGRQPRW